MSQINSFGYSDGCYKKCSLALIYLRDIQTTSVLINLFYLSILFFFSPEIIICANRWPFNISLTFLFYHGIVSYGYCKAQDLCRIPLIFWLRKCSNSVKGAGQKYKVILHVTWPLQNRRPDWQVTFPIAPVNRWSCFQHNFTLNRATCLRSITLQMTERKIGKQEHRKLGSTIRIFFSVNVIFLLAPSQKEIHFSLSPVFVPENVMLFFYKS